MSELFNFKQFRSAEESSLDIKTVLFQAVLFSLSTLFKYQKISISSN